MSLRFHFDCPACTVETDVDADVRATLLQDGCVLCETPVTTDAFSRRSATDPTE